MKDLETKGSIVFFSIIASYIAIGPLVNFLGGDQLFSLIAKIFVIGLLLIIFREWFPFKFRFDFLAIIVGILIGIIWVGLDSFYPKIYATPEVLFTLPEILLKLGTGILIAPIVEEFFTKYFLHRFLQGKKWLLVPLGQFSLMPFLVTTLFFGFAHNQWVVGLIAGAMLNLLWYKRKDMNSVVVAHGMANLVLWLFIVIFELWHFWV